MYPQQGNMARNASLSMQPPFRNGNSPVQNPLHAPPQQRLPPGLANLGGRPPHDPTQFVGSGMGIGGGLPGNNGPMQPPFNNLSGPGGFGGGPQMRGPPPGAHQLQNALGHNALAGLGHPNKLDMRGPTQAQINQAQLLGMGNGMGAGVGVGVGGGMRGPGAGFPLQQGLNAQMQGSNLAMRQQQQQQQHQVPPHMLPQMLPPHLQQQLPPGSTSQPAHDLMALLMGGQRN